MAKGSHMTEEQRMECLDRPDTDGLEGQICVFSDGSGTQSEIEALTGIAEQLGGKLVSHPVVWGGVYRSILVPNFTTAEEDGARIQTGFEEIPVRTTLEIVHVEGKLLHTTRRAVDLTIAQHAVGVKLHDGKSPAETYRVIPVYDA
jgi:hypothetical protein